MENNSVRLNCRTAADGDGLLVCSNTIIYTQIYWDFRNEEAQRGGDQHCIAPNTSSSRVLNTASPSYLQHSTFFSVFQAGLTERSI